MGTTTTHFTENKMYYNFVAYSKAKYKSYTEAKASGAIFQTGSSIDSLSFDGFYSGFYDLLEITHEIEKCLGVVGELEWGIIREDEFIGSEQLSQEIEKEQAS